MGVDPAVVYWDASALLSVLFRDEHSAAACRWAEAPGEHLLSTLAWAEVCAVVGCMKREGILSDSIEAGVFEALDQGPWRRLAGLPDWEAAKVLSRKWALRGADLWHLAMVMSLRRELPELMMLTFDARLEQAARGEGCVPAQASPDHRPVPPAEDTPENPTR